MIKIIEKAKKEHILTKEEIITLLLSSDSDVLFQAANEVRQTYIGNDVYLRALVEFSNICRCNCFYCGLRSENKNISRYRLSKEEILDVAQKATSLGFKTIVLQSGEDSFYSIGYLSSIIREIKKYDIAVTLGIGEKTKEEYKLLKDAGTDRFLLRIETTDENLYQNLHPHMSFENRKKCLFDLKELGYETGTGCLVGLPNQTVESLADDILFFKELDADMIGIGPLIIHPDTPLNSFNNGSFILALKVMAITRLIMPDINIPATTAMETLNPNGQIIALQSGANVIMPNLTPEKNRNQYQIYPDKFSLSLDVIKEKIELIGRNVSSDYGFRKKNNLT